MKIPIDKLNSLGAVSTGEWNFMGISKQFPCTSSFPLSSLRVCTGWGRCFASTRRWHCSSEKHCVGSWTYSLNCKALCNPPAWISKHLCRHCNAAVSQPDACLHVHDVLHRNRNPRDKNFCKESMKTLSLCHSYLLHYWKCCAAAAFPMEEAPTGAMGCPKTRKLDRGDDLVGMLAVQVDPGSWFFTFGCLLQRHPVFYWGRMQFWNMCA